MPGTERRAVADAYLAFRLANKLHRRWPALYVPLYDAYKRVSDRREIRLIRERVAPGMTCVDVGANVGFYTDLLARRVGPRGQVLAFEPAPDNLALLRRRTLGPAVRVFDAAVGATSGETALYLSDDLNVDHRTYPAEDERRKVAVRQVRLDDVVPEGAVDFVKMDIQGYELHALRGMLGVLRRSPRLTMVTEFWPWGIRQAGGDPREVLSLLVQVGYEPRWMDGGRVERFEESPTWYANVIASRA